MEPPFEANEVAKYFINLANECFIDDEFAEGITNLKLQKILYFAQSAFLSTQETHTPLFNEEIQAWKFGPVVPDIYHLYKSFGNRPIELADDGVEWDLPANVQVFLDSVWSIYGKYSATELVEITHNHKPWKLAFFSTPGSNTTITTETLREHYRGYFSVE